MWVLLIGCIASNMATYAMSMPRGECKTALQGVEHRGGPDLWTASEEDLDRWLEEYQDVSYLYDKAYYACWADDDA